MLAVVIIVLMVVLVLCVRPTRRRQQSEDFRHHDLSTKLPLLVYVGAPTSKDVRKRLGSIFQIKCGKAVRVMTHFQLCAAHLSVHESLEINC